MDESSQEDGEGSTENSEGKELLLKRLDNYFREFDSYRKQFEPEWEEYERYYNNIHWRHDENKTKKNWIFTVIETELPVMTSSRPASDVIPWDDGPEEDEKAKSLSAATAWVYDDQNLEIKTVQAERQSLITGTGYLYGDYDPDLNGGDGAVTIQVLNWRNVWLDPGVSDIKDSHCLFIKFPVRVANVARRFKLDEKDIPRIDPKFLSVTESNGESYDGSQYTSALNSVNPNRYGGDDMTVIDEVWLKDYSMTSIPPEETAKMIEEEHKQLYEGIAPDIGKFEDHQAHIAAHSELKLLLVADRLQVPPGALNEAQVKEAIEADEELSLLAQIIDDHIASHGALMAMNPEGKKPKYKNNLRLIIKIDQEIYYDGAPPVEEDDCAPLTPYYCYKGEGPYGFGEVKNILPSQKSYNDMDFAEYENLKRNSNSGWKKDTLANVDDSTLTNEPGLVVTHQPGGSVERLPPGEVSPQFQNRQNKDLDAIQRISGQQEAAQGIRPVGVTSGIAIDRLQQQSTGRTNLKVRTTAGYSCLLLGKIVARRIIKYWPTEKKLRLYDERARLKSVSYNPDSMVDFRYEVKIVPGATTGIDKETIFAFMSEMTIKGLLPPQVFFQVTDIPHKNKILDYFEHQDQLKNALAQLQQENLQMKYALGIVDEQGQPFPVDINGNPIQGQGKGKQGPKAVPPNQNQNAGLNYQQPA